MAVPCDSERAAALRVLGLPAEATREQVAQAYRRLARTVHPDVTGRRDSAAGDRFAAISDAYHQLATDPGSTTAAIDLPVEAPASVPSHGTSPLITASPVVVTPHHRRTTGRPTIVVIVA